MERDYLSSLLNLFRKRINKIFVGLLVIIIAACDFDNPADFVVPTWFIDIKLPLVSKRFPMGDLVDTANFIYPTDDSSRFQILFGSDIEPPFEPDQIPIDVLFEGGRISQSVSEEFGGVPEAEILIDQSIPPEELTSVFPISVLQYNSLFYLDTTLIIILGDTQSVEIGGVIWYGTPFQFPLDGEKIMSAEFYNTFLVDPMNDILDSLLGIINAAFPLELPFDIVMQQIPAEASFISDIDSLIIASGAASVYSSYFKNKGYQTGLVDIYSRLLSGSDSTALNDTLANHVQDSLFYTDNPFEEGTSLAGEGLSKFLSIALGCRLERAPPNSFVNFQPGENDSLYIDFKVQLGIPGISSIVVSMDETNLPLGDQIDQFKSQLNFSSNMPEMEGTTLEIKTGTMDVRDSIDARESISQIFKDYGNKMIIDNLQSSFPWDLKFYLYIPNFMPPSTGGDLVKIDTVLSAANPAINKTFELYGYTLEPLPPETILGSLACSLAVIIPAQQATIPLGSESLGGFGLDLSFGSLFFDNFQAFIYQELTADTLDITGYPSEMTGIGFPGLEFEFEFEYSVNLPLGININMVGVSPSGEQIKSPLTISLPTPESYSVSKVKSIIRWNKSGSTTLSTLLMIQRNGLTAQPRHQFRVKFQLLIFLQQCH